MRELHSEHIYTSFFFEISKFFFEKKRFFKIDKRSFSGYSSFEVRKIREKERMHVPSLEKLRFAIAKKENSEISAPPLFFPFWKMEPGTSTVVRFVPDADTSNDTFWREEQVIFLPFPGTTRNSDRPVRIRVPCMKMFGKPDPILSDISSLWKKNDELARKYYRRRNYVYSGFVRSTSLKEENFEKISLRLFRFTSSLHSIILQFLQNPDLEFVPVDPENGRNFSISRTRKGAYADYSTSSFSLKPSSLTKEEREFVEKNGLLNLSNFLVKMPDSEDLREIFEMYLDSRNGKLLDEEKYARWIRN